MTSADVICAACGAMNRPGVIYVEPTPSGVWFCTVCGKLTAPAPRETP